MLTANFGFTGCLLPAGLIRSSWRKRQKYIGLCCVKRVFLCHEAIKKCRTFASANTGIAQLVEHRSPKPSVGSSSLSSRAGSKKPQLMTLWLLFFIDLTCKKLF